MQAQAEDLFRQIADLKKSQDAVILAHNYQVPQVQDVADYVGDSLGLARQAARTPNRRIIFCGVHFMAETASILCPDKTVLIPDTEAGCSLSDSITASQLREWKGRHPDAVSVGYVNTTAEVKAELDYCCTSSNAVRIVESIPDETEVLFLPDMFLGSYVARQTGRKNMRVWAGECHVHAGISAQDVIEKMDSAPGTELLIHPECSCTSPVLYDAAAGEFDGRPAGVYSTEGMLKRASESPASRFVVATETGMLYRMRKQNPSKTFVPASERAECQYMKMTTLQSVRDSLQNDEHRVRVSKDVAEKARRPIERMLQIS